jgi:hypothetical protein
MSEEKYVTRLRMAKCSMGTMTNYLNLPKDHGVIFTNEEFPIMNSNDHVPEQHVIHFGRCNSNKNIENVASAVKTILNPFLWGSTILKKVTGVGGCKCNPKTFQPWIQDKEDYLIDGAPAITENSQLVCYYGGIITVEPEGTE